MNSVGNRAKLSWKLLSPISRLALAKSSLIAPKSSSVNLRLSPLGLISKYKLSFSVGNFFCTIKSLKR